MSTATEYHVLVKGFELNQRKNDNYESTDLRHYRYPTTEFTYETKNGKDMFYRNNILESSFPANLTLVLVEPIRERNRD